MCQQAFIGVLYFRCAHDLEQGLRGASFVLRERGLKYNLRSCAVAGSDGVSVNDHTLFCIDVETTGSLVMFWDIVSAMRRLTLFSSLGEVSCWMNIGGNKQVETLVARLEGEQGMI